MAAPLGPTGHQDTGELSGALGEGLLQGSRLPRRGVGHGAQRELERELERECEEAAPRAAQEGYADDVMGFFIARFRKVR
jgi:hypothetical protein